MTLCDTGPLVAIIDQDDPDHARCAAALALIPVMALSRTVVDAHWLTDTAAGAVCGAGVAAAVVALLAPTRP